MEETSSKVGQLHFGLLRIGKRAAKLFDRHGARQKLLHVGGHIPNEISPSLRVVRSGRSSKEEITWPTASRLWKVPG